jgi:hypothetical protein
MKLSCRFTVAAAALLFPTALEADAGETRRVLLLHSFEPHFCTVERRVGRCREELIKQSPNAIGSLRGFSGDRTSRAGSNETPFVEYLRSLFTGRDLNLVVAMGAPAARFVLRYRAQIFASTPLLITEADQGSARPGLTRRATASAAYQRRNSATIALKPSPQTAAGP